MRKAATATTTEKELTWNKVMAMKSSINRIQLLARRAAVLVLPALLSLSVSCAKLENGSGDTPSDGGQKTYLKINSVSTSELTKSAIEGTTFPTAQAASIGLFIGDTNNAVTTKPAGSDKWSDPEIELPSEGATLYGYYPFSAEATDKTAIPVSSSVDGSDWMWATPVDGVCASKPNVSLSMNHALALVEITFNIYGYDSSTKMTGITLTGESFSADGTLDATTGAVAPGTSCGTGNELSNVVELSQTDGKIVAKCLLVPAKVGTDADARQDFKVSVTLGAKTLSASLTGDKGVIVRQGTKSTILLNIKDGDSKMEVVSVGVDGWDDKVSGSTAEVNGHTVTFNCPEGFKYDLEIKHEATAFFDEETESAMRSSVIFRYEQKELTGSRFFFLSEPSGCKIAHDAQNGIITITDLTQDVTVDAGYGTYIPYTATARVEPADKNAFGFPYDDKRSTFSGGSGVIAILGELENIGRVAFDGNTSLTGVDLSGCENLKTIKEFAFNGCTNLTSVKLPEGLETIEKNVFWHMGVSSDAQPQKITFPSTLKSIGNWAFEQARISGIEGFGGNFESFGQGTFKSALMSSVDLSGCSALTAIPESCFEQCDNLASIDLGGCTSLKTIGKVGFAYCDILTSVILPQGLEVIGDSAFWGMGVDAKGELTPFVDGSGKVLDEQYWYSGAKKLEFPNTLKSIGAFAFENATIREFSLPVSLKTVGESAFKGSCVHWVTIQAEENNGIETGATIGSNMLINCTSLYRLYVNYKTPPVLSNNFLSGSHLNQRGWIVFKEPGDGIYVPSGSLGKYEAADIWKDYETYK